MGKFPRATDDSPFHSGEDVVSVEIKNMAPIQAGVVEPESLSGMKIAYAVYAEEAATLVGTPSAGFAFFLDDCDTLVVVHNDSSKVNTLSLNCVMEVHAMQAAQEWGASFTTLGKSVVCNVKGYSQVGSNYGEAALRAILAYKRHQKKIPDDE